MSSETAKSSVDELLGQARDAYRRRRWREALDLLTKAESTAPLEPADYELLASADYLLTAEGRGFDILERAHRTFLERDDVRRAAKAAFWLGMALLNTGEPGRSSGWIERARRLLDDAGLDDCAERAYLGFPLMVRANLSGDFETGMRLARESLEAGRRLGDPDLVIMSLMSEGRARLGAGDIDGGRAVMDEVMVAITAGDCSPVLAGTVYCSVITGLSQVYDARRAREWTAAMQSWCDSQPDLVMFRGECSVHLAELLNLSGDWRAALDKTVEAGRRLEGPPPHPAAGSAFYQEGELHRLAGRFAEAERAYRKSAELGRSPQPGLALLWLEQGRIEDAEGAARRAFAEAHGGPELAALLPGYFAIMLAAGDLAAAREASYQLTAVAAANESDLLRAAAAHARGATRLAEGDPSAALAELRQAEVLWRDVDAAHQAAQTRALIGVACRELGDGAGATLELESARQAFARLGAAPDVERVDRMLGARSGKAGLTGRELELLRLLATGKTNREIADSLVISEKTVARHVSNIFNKLGVSSRAGATAYAFQHNLA